jgi:WD40 repeat protein
MNRHIGALNCREAFWMEFSKDGTILVAVAPRLVRTWNLAGASEKLVLKGHAAAVSSVVFSPDGKFLATSGRDHKIKIWNPTTCTLLKELEFPTAVEGLSFSPDGLIMAAGNYDNVSVRFYDVESWKPLNVLPVSVGDLVLATGFSPDGRHFAASGTHGLTLWRVVRGDGEHPTKMTISFQSSRRLSEKYSASICFSPDSNWLAWAEVHSWADNSYPVHVWDLEKSQPHAVSMAQSADPMKALGFSPDNKHLTFVNSKLAIEVWDVTTRQEVSSSARLSRQSRHTRGRILT